MGIRFDYQVGAGMIGAYAAGQQEASRRKQKYGMAMLAQQQAHQNRMEELGTRYGGALGARRGAGQQGMAQQGVWTDPLQQVVPGGGGAFGNQQQVIHNRAARRARERKIRLGKPIPPQWQPTFESQDSIDQRKTEQQDAWELADSQRTARVTHLRPVPADLSIIDPVLANKLAGMRADIQQMAIGGELDFRNDPDGHAQKALDAKIKQYEDLIENAPKADPNQGSLIRDPQTGLLRPINPGSGEKPTHSWGGAGTEPQLLPEHVAMLKKQEAEVEEAEKLTLETEQKAADAKRERQDYYRERFSTYRNERNKQTGSAKWTPEIAMQMAKADTIAAFGEEVTEAPDPSVPSRGLLGVATLAPPVVTHGPDGASVDDIESRMAPDVQEMQLPESKMQGRRKEPQPRATIQPSRFDHTGAPSDVLTSEAVYYTDAGKQVLKGRSIPRPPAGQEGNLKDGQLVQSTIRGTPLILRWNKKAGKYSIVAELDAPESAQPPLKLL